MGPQQQKAHEARQRRNDLNRKIQTRLGRIAVLQGEIEALTEERDELNAALPKLDEKAHKEWMAERGVE